jgi:preprotein translocase subunit SecE
VAEETRQNPITRYFRETMGELRKVNWPTWAEVKQLTLIVIAVMVVMGVYLSLVDGLGYWLISLALGAQ